MTGPDNRL